MRPASAAGFRPAEGGGGVFYLPPPPAEHLRGRGGGGRGFPRGVWKCQQAVWSLIQSAWPIGIQFPFLVSLGVVLLAMPVEYTAEHPPDDAYQAPDEQLMSVAKVYADETGECELRWRKIMI